MMDTSPVASTRLAQWLNRAMSTWEDPDTGRYGLSGRRLGTMIGVSQAQVWEVLKGGKIPKADTLIRLADFFEVNPLFLFRLAYLEEEELSQEAFQRFAVLETIVGRLDREQQAEYVETLLAKARREIELNAVTQEQ